MTLRNDGAGDGGAKFVWDDDAYPEQLEELRRAYAQNGRQGPPGGAQDGGEGSGGPGSPGGASGAPGGPQQARVHLNDADLSDTSLACRMVEREGGMLRYLPRSKRWRDWKPETGIWKEHLAPLRAVVEFMAWRVWFIENRTLEGDQERIQSKQWQKNRATLLSLRKQEAVLKIFSALPGVAFDDNLWREDPHLMGTPTGVVDLRTGELRIGKPEELISKKTAIAPDFDAEPTNWLRFLGEIFAHDPELIPFIQRWLGYMLTGDVSEQKLIYAYGEGNNGKSTLFGTFQELLGDYAIPLQKSVLMKGSPGRHLSELAQLQGVRMGVCSEVDPTAGFDIERVKKLTGDGTWRANFMHSNPITVRSEAKLVVFANEIPSTASVELTMRRRLLFVPFSTVIPAERVDPQLMERLRAEWPAILAWAVKGAMAWYAARDLPADHPERRNRLLVPASVTKRTGEYFDGEDVVEQWIEAQCRYVPEGKYRRTQAWEDFERWRQRTRTPAINRHTFFARMAKKDPDPNRKLKRFQIKPGQVYERFRDGYPTYLGIEPHVGTMDDGVDAGETRRKPRAEFWVIDNEEKPAA